MREGFTTNHGKTIYEHKLIAQITSTLWTDKNIKELIKLLSFKYTSKQLKTDHIVKIRLHAIIDQPSPRRQTFLNGEDP
jgi:hypothetical protein